MILSFAVFNLQFDISVKLMKYYRITSSRGIVIGYCTSDSDAILKQYTTDTFSRISKKEYLWRVTGL